jgi:sensor histidine kinase YesM
MEEAGAERNESEWKYRQMKKILAVLWRGIVILWENYLLRLRFAFYILVIMFLLFGVVAAFTGGPGLGIFLVVVNGLFLLLMRMLDKAADAQFDKEFQEMVRKNRKENEDKC